MRDTCDIVLVGRAMHMAIEAHADQKYGERPYYTHLLEVYEHVRATDPEDAELAAAAWLHDAVEDTYLTAEVILNDLDSQRVADLVYAVSDGPGANRRERKELPYTVIPTVPGALVLKMCDRLANIRSCIRTENEGLLSMYRKEHETFRARLIRDRALTQDERMLWRTICDELGGRR